MNNDKYFYLNIKVFFFSHAKIRMSRQPVKPVGSEFYIETGEPRKKKKRVYKKDEKAGNDPCCETDHAPNPPLFLWVLCNLI